jgi:hypothetical protein
MEVVRAGFGGACGRVSNGKKVLRFGRLCPIDRMLTSGSNRVKF